VHETIGVAVVAEVVVALIVKHALIDGLEEAPDVELDAVGSLRGVRQ